MAEQFTVNKINGKCLMLLTEVSVYHFYLESYNFSILSLVIPIFFVEAEKSDDK